VMIAADSVIASSSKKKRKGRRKNASVNEKKQEDEDDSRSFSVNFCFSEKVIEIRRPKTSPVLIGEECQSAITLALLQFEEIYGSKFTWDEPIVDSPVADDTNSVIKCLLVSNDKISCQLIAPTVATTTAVTKNTKKIAIMPTSGDGSACVGCELLKNEIRELNSRIETQNSRIETQNSRIETQNSRIETQNSRIDALITQTQFLFGNALVVQKIHMRLFISLMGEKITQVLKKFPVDNNWYSFLSDVLSSPEDLGKIGLTAKAVETIRDLNKINKLNKIPHSASAIDIALAISAMEESDEKELFKTVLYPMLFDGLDVDDVVF
jgi:hypothetical protein